MVEVTRPHTFAQALEVRASLPGASLLAGGTDFMVDVHFGRRRPGDVIALRRVDELRTVAIDSHHVELGALVTYEMMQSAAIAEALPALATAARGVGSPGIRSCGTIGGNVATASPAGDCLPLLAAMDAEVVLASGEASRGVLIGDFITGPKQTSLQGSELIQSLKIPRLHGPQHFLKIGTRNAMVISIASCAVVVDISNQKVRIGLGSVGPRPLRAETAETFLSSEFDWEHMRISENAILHGANLAGHEATPITDHRGTQEYRRHAVTVMVQRALARSIAR
jgi:CO/xanthine dehydrogenase FAD-binding subunit